MKRLFKKIQWLDNAKRAGKMATYGLVWTVLGTALVFVWDIIVDIVLGKDPD